MRPCLPAPRLVALLLGLCGVVGSSAADTLIAAGQWRTGDGLPLDSVSALALDSHGYLWVGTTDGLARFDGQRFQTFRRDATPTLPENRIARLHALADGSLIVHLESEEFGRFSVREGYRPLGRTGREQLVSAGNEVWYVAPSGLGHWQPSGEPRIALPLDVTALARESAAAGSTEAPSLLLGTRSGRLLRYRPHRGELTELASAGDSEPILSIASGPDEDIAFASLGSLHRLWGPPQARRLGRFALGDAEPAPPVMAWSAEGFVLNPLSRGVGVDRRPVFDGSRLLPAGDEATRGFSATRLGLVDAAGRRWINHGRQLTRDGQPVFAGEPLIQDFVVDRYGQVWLGTLRDGLLKLVEPPLQTLGNRPDELFDNNVYFIANDADGALLIGSYRGLDRYDPASGGWTRLRERRSLAVLADGDRVLVADETLCSMPPGGGECLPVPGLDAGAGMATLLHRDRHGAVWVGGRDGVYLRRADDRWFGPLLPGTKVRDALELDDGRLLLASADRGVAIADTGEPLGSPRVLIDEARGLPSNRIRALFHDQGEEILIGLEDRGICLYHLQRGLQRCIGVAEGLPHHSVHRMLADDHGRLWINSNDGIYALARTELRAVLQGRSDHVAARRFGVADGMASSEGNGGVNSAGTRTADGRLWFPTQRGVVTVQPAHILAQAFPLTATVRPQDPQLDPAGISLPPDRRVLHLRLGAIALRGSKDLQLRWRLDQRDWVSARPGELVLDGLAPGTHRVDVAARYADGDWGTPTTLPFAVPPQFGERTDVRIGGVLLLAALLVALFVRERSHARRLERRVDERTESLRSALRTVGAQAEQIRVAAAHRQQWYLTISHELRTPLTSLLGPLDSPQPPTARQLERMRRSALQMRDMIEELLLLERLDHDGGSRLQPERLAPLLRRAIEPQRSALEAAGVELVVDTGSDGQHERLRVLAEPAQLERAIGTLIGNALAHAGRQHAGQGQHGQISLSLDTDVAAHTILLHVDDDGPGIPPGERERVLRPFAKGDASSPHGFGLGLALCQRIVLQHRGRLDISDSPLGGARITLRLPLLQDEASSEAGAAASDAPVVLVVDDDADIRAYLGELLGQHYQVLLAADGEEGQRIAGAELPDAIVSDINMPGVDGIEMVRRLRAEPETSVIPVIFLTAYGQQEIEARAFSAGGDQFLAKPFRPEQLLLRIERMFAYRKDLLARYPGSADVAAAPLAAEPLPRKPSLLERFQRVLEQRLGDPDLDIDELCRELGVSRATLYRRLENSNGLTPSDYLRNLRLDRAAALLRDSDEQVSTVAYAVGFRRLSAFTRSFTTHFGCAPSLYRRSAREAGNGQP